MPVDRLLDPAAVFDLRRGDLLDLLRRHHAVGAPGEVGHDEVADGHLPVRLRPAHQAGQGDAAAQRLEEARVAGEQREGVRRPVRAEGPADGAAVELHGDDQVQAAADHRPQLRDEPLVGGDQPVVPQTDGEVAGVVALHARRHLGAVAVLGGPGPVGALPAGQPAVGGAGAVVLAAEVQGHGRLDGVPRVELAAPEPGEGAVGVLLRGDPGDGGPHLVAGQHPGQLRERPGGVSRQGPAPPRSARSRPPTRACRRRSRSSCRTPGPSASRRSG